VVLLISSIDVVIEAFVEHAVAHLEEVMSAGGSITFLPPVSQ
jgi:molybdopterin converting factor small subunit